MDVEQVFPQAGCFRRSPLETLSHCGGDHLESDCAWWMRAGWSRRSVSVLLGLLLPERPEYRWYFIPLSTVSFFLSVIY